MDELAFGRWYRRLLDKKRLKSRSKSIRTSSAEPPQVINKFAEWNQKETWKLDENSKISKIKKQESAEFEPNSDSYSDVPNTEPDTEFDLENPPPVNDLPDEGNKFFVPNEDTVSFFVISD